MFIVIVLVRDSPSILVILKVSMI